MAWSYIQSVLQNAQFDGTGGVTTAAALGTTVAAGDIVIGLTTVGQDPAPLSPTVTDSLGNTYVRKGNLYLSANSQGYDYWLSIITAPGTPTITYTPNAAIGASWIAFKFDKFTGSDAASVARVAGPGAVQASPGTTANIISSGSIAAQSGDLLWTAGAMQNPDVTMAIGTGFSATSAIDATTGFLTEFKTATGAGAGTFTDATGGGSHNYATFAMAITPAGGGGGGSVKPMPYYLRQMGS